MKSFIGRGSFAAFLLVAGFIIAAPAASFADDVGYVLDGSAGFVGTDTNLGYVGAQETASAVYAPQETASAVYAPQETASAVYAPQETASAVYAPTTAYDVYDIYATPNYGYGGGYGYGGMGYASLGFGSSFYPSYYPSYSYSPTPSYIATAPSNTYTSTYAPTTVSNPTYTYSPTTVTDTTSVYAPTNTSTYAPTSVYAPADSHNVVSTDSHNNTTISVVSNTAQAAPQYPVQYVYSAPAQGYSSPAFYNTPTYFPQMPSCVITASAGAYNLNYGSGAVTLSWTSTNANSGYISPLVGTVAPAGSTTVYPNQDTLYTLTVSGNGGTASCQTRTAYQATAVAPYVALTQIPYTGFDFGTFGNAAYWTLLALFAVAVSYLALYYRGGALALVTSMIRREAKAPVSEKKEAAVAVSETKPAPAAQFRGTRDAMLSVGAAGGAGPRIVVLRA